MIEIYAITFLISIILNIFFQRYFIRKGKYDKINFRSSHNVKATRSGGSSFFVSIFIITLFFYFNSNEIFDFSILIPLGILFTVGLYDDIYEVDFKLKFIFQFIIAKILVDQGLLIDNLNGFLGFYEISYMISQVLTIIFIIFIINATNFTDGIDGLAITEANKFIIISIFLTKVGVYNGYETLFVFTLISLIPLYYFNFKTEKKVFLGDSGSLTLGGIVAIGLILVINNSSNSLNMSTPLLIICFYLYPIIDSLYVIIYRLSKGKSPFYADNSHIHHKLLNYGFSHVKTLLLISGITGIIQLSLIYITSFS